MLFDLSIVWTIISFIIIFSVIVIGHEGGHFLIARINGIHVVEFTVGLGPKIFHFTKNGTIFSLRALPFGGACIFENPDDADDNEEKKSNEEDKLVEDLISSKNTRAFKDANVWSRIATVAAGPIFNVILAFFLGLLVCFVCGEMDTTVGDVLEGYPAYEAGLQPGDRIVKINNERVYLFAEIQLLSYVDTHETWKVEYERNNEIYSCDIVPIFNSSTTRVMGITSSPPVSCKNLKMFKYSALEVRYWLKATFKSLRMLVTGRLTKDDLSGPVGIAKVIDDTIEETSSYGFLTVFINLVNIALLLSVNLAVMNLLPFPALDGGRLVFLIIESITHKKVSEKVEAVIHAIGFVLLTILAIFVLFNDITKFFR